MTDDPVSLDGHRSAAARSQRTFDATHCRTLRPIARRYAAVRKSSGTIPGEPCGNVVRGGCEGAVSFRLYGATADAQDARRAKLIERALGDLARLIDRDTVLE